MSEYLKNPKTGVVFRATRILMKNAKHLEPCDKDGRSIFDEVPVPGNDQTPAPSGAVSESGIIIDQATKPELLKFAAENFGEKIPTRTSVEEVREIVRQLIEAE